MKPYTWVIGFSLIFSPALCNSAFSQSQLTPTQIEQLRNLHNIPFTIPKPVEMPEPLKPEEKPILTIETNNPNLQKCKTKSGHIGIKHSIRNYDGTSSIKCVSRQDEYIQPKTRSPR
jgi:hypothetical protein